MQRIRTLNQFLFEDPPAPLQFMINYPERDHKQTDLYFLLKSWKGHLSVCVSTQLKMDDNCCAVHRRRP